MTQFTTPYLVIVITLALVATGVEASDPPAPGLPPVKTEDSFIPKYSAGSVYYLWTTRNGFRDIDGASLRMQEGGFRVPIPILMKERYRFLTGISYRWNRLTFSGFGPLGGNLDLHRLQVPVDFWYAINPRWKFWARIEPGLFSDFKQLTFDDLTLTALVLVSYQWTPQWSFASGAYFSRDLGEDQLLPALGAIWRPNKHWVLSLTFPRFYATYAPIDRFFISAFAYPSGGGWNIQDPSSKKDRDLNYRIIRAGLGFETRLTKRFWSFLETGYQFDQRLELGGVGNSDLEGSWFLSGGLRLRF